MTPAMKIFDILFDDGDYIVYGEKYCRNSVPKKYTVKGDDRYGVGYSYNHYKSEDGSPMKLQTAQYLLLNPVYKNTTRKKSNISKFRSFLLESDSLPLDIQWKVLLYAMKYHNLPLSYVLFSGNKSYHAVITLVDPVDGTYLKRSSEFLDFLDGMYFHPADIFSNFHYRLVLGMDFIVREMMELPVGHKNKIPYSPPNKAGHYFDQGNKDVSRLSRFPCSVFQDYKKNTDGSVKSYTRNQTPKLILGRVGRREFIKFLKKCPQIQFFCEKKDSSDILFGDVKKDFSEDTFLERCSKELLLKIDFFKNNSTSSEMHPHIRSFFLLLFKEFKGLTLEQALSVAEDHIFPYLIEAGYDSDKLYKNTTIKWCYDTVNNKE